MTAFIDRLRAAQAHTGTCLCVGLDPDPERLPEPLRLGPPPGAFVSFLKDVIRASAPFACAYKPNMAFFEAYGSAGVVVLEQTLRSVRRYAPHALVVLDGKRGDIGNTAHAYARAAFEAYEADALTVAPYMGHDSVTPFLEHAGRAAFVLARTSNPGAADFQERTIEGRPLYTHVVQAALGWGSGMAGTVGFVAGATDPGALEAVRRLAPEAPLLVPGVGAQGGDAAAVLTANAGGPVLVNVGRDILYARHDAGFAEGAAEAAERFARLLPAP
ncbi:MAG TPA: orotidine-5'-phosphate decarboxylase [Rhodothermales bacterium]|nr:orotidine-5'-phosphate decarboxylase [Rhodothermales bacterium]